MAESKIESIYFESMLTLFFTLVFFNNFRFTYSTGLKFLSLFKGVYKAYLSTFLGIERLRHQKILAINRNIETYQNPYKNAIIRSPITFDVTMYGSTFRTSYDDVITHFAVFLVYCVKFGMLNKARCQKTATYVNVLIIYLQNLKTELKNLFKNSRSAIFRT